MTRSPGLTGRVWLALSMATHRMWSSARHFDSSWNWVHQDALLMYYDIYMTINFMMVLSVWALFIQERCSNLSIFYNNICSKDLWLVTINLKQKPKHRTMDLVQPFSDLEEHDELSAPEIESLVSFVIQWNVKKLMANIAGDWRSRSCCGFVWQRSNVSVWASRGTCSCYGAATRGNGRCSQNPTSSRQGGFSFGQNTTYSEEGWVWWNSQQKISP